MFLNLPTTTTNLVSNITGKQDMIKHQKKIENSGSHEISGMAAAW